MNKQLSPAPSKGRTINPFSHTIGAASIGAKGEGSFGKFVASKIAKPIRLVANLAEQNGRKEYTPGTIGYTIWATASALQAHTPNTMVTAEAMCIALPNLNPRSVSTGLSHWKKFNGLI